MVTVIPEEKVIYLTFDDGPSIYTEDVLALLERYDIKATFFVCDTARSQLIAKIHEAGHTIGIHCQNHDYLRANGRIHHSGSVPGRELQ